MFTAPLGGRIVDAAAVWLSIKGGKPIRVSNQQRTEMRMMFIAIASVLALTASAQAQPILQADPYKNCIAEASPIFGSTMTIENLRDYMATHPCQESNSAPVQYKYVPTVCNETDIACQRAMQQLARDRAENNARWAIVKDDPSQFCDLILKREMPGAKCLHDNDPTYHSVRSAVEDAIRNTRRR